MVDSDSTSPEAGQADNRRQLVFEKLYVKDLSFESPNAPQVFSERNQPAVDMNLSSNSQHLGNDHYEVVLAVTLSLRVEEKTIYLVEVHQAGVFLLRGFSDQERGPLLGSYCPNALFPFAREVVADLAGKGGFAPFLLAPVNFDALYTQHVQAQKRANDPVEH